MGIYRGPNLIKEGLVFGYDTGYGVSSNSVATRYNPGEPTTNMYTNSDFSNGESDWTFSSWDGNISHTATTVQGPYGNTVSAVKFTVNSASSYSHFHQYNNNKYTSGNAYTQSAWVKGYGTMWGKSHWGGNTQFTMTGDWQYITYTVSATTSSSSNFPYWGGEGLTPGTVFYMTDAQTEANSHATPYVKSGSTTGSRSNTESLIDLKRTANIDLSNVSFDSTAQHTFDGTDDKIVIADQTSIGAYTYETVVKINSADSSYSGFGSNYKSDASGYSGVGNGWVLRLDPSGNLQIYTKNNSTTLINPINISGFRANNSNKYIHLVYTYEDGSNKLYLNGALQQTGTGLSGETASDSTLIIGAYSWGISSQTYYLNGYQPVAKLYNTTLSADEVKQNYKVYKNRFNI